MGTEAIVFYVLAFIMIVASLAAVTALRILRAAVYLLFALGATAAIYFMVSYYFLAAVQLIVYAGGIVVLIIFSILLTSHVSEKLQKPNALKIIFTAFLVLMGAGMVWSTFSSYAFLPEPSTGLVADMTTIGEKMMGYGEKGYVLPFEVISILLLAAMIGAIAVAKRTQQKQDD